MCHIPGARLRLSGGKNGCEGRVEVYNGSSWGTVCDDWWDLRDAQVVCQQLGCGRPMAAPGSARFGRGSGPIFLDNVQCRGDEPSLQTCRHNGWGVHNCGHVEDASVICAGAWAAEASGSPAHPTRQVSVPSLGSSRAYLPLYSRGGVATLGAFAAWCWKHMSCKSPISAHRGHSRLSTIAGVGAQCVGKEQD